MPSYFYKCSVCKNDYNEIRDEDVAQHFTICSCGGTFEEVSK
jgi:uncharacterized protein (DUF983 family)